MRLFIFIFAILFYSASYAQNTSWLLVDTGNRVLQVRQEGQVLDTFEHIALGRQGGKLKQQKGDDITPLGRFKIVYTNNQSKFRKFFGLNYPSIQDAGLALFAARISYQEYQMILDAHRNNKLPPQNTALGGRIGIHGVGNGNSKVHSEFDWTQGCIALSNRQIDRLAKWVYTGMPVQVK